MSFITMPSLIPCRRVCYPRRARATPSTVTCSSLTAVRQTPCTIGHTISYHIMLVIQPKALPNLCSHQPRQIPCTVRTTGSEQCLLVQLKEEFGSYKPIVRDAPPKWALFGVNKRPELIERRRRELEMWLWKLVADPEVARSRMLNNFLELSDAARMVTK